MKLAPTTAIGPRRGRGFTVIELLIAVAIIGLLISIAFPTYQGSLRKSRRTEAITALNNIQQAQERWRSNQASYAASLTQPAGGSPPGLAFASERTEKGYYDLSLAVIDPPTSYQAVATAVTGTAQEGDTACRVMAVRTAGGNVRYGAGSSLSEIDWTAADVDPKRCWAR